ncbi:hypothetical protein BS78_05G146800 [Paspalum vaginatum]|nr:hypothetical protein BS78_05G146800 [Paspalum vaginatum]
MPILWLNTLLSCAPFPLLATGCLRAACAAGWQAVVSTQRGGGQRQPAVLRLQPARQQQSSWPRRPPPPLRPLPLLLSPRSPPPPSVGGPSLDLLPPRADPPPPRSMGDKSGVRRPQATKAPCAVAGADTRRRQRAAVGDCGPPPTAAGTTTPRLSTTRTCAPLLASCHMVTRC